MVTGMLGREFPSPFDFPLCWVTEHKSTSRGEASIRTPKVPVRLQRHCAWDPFLCTSSQSLAVHIPCWSVLYPEESYIYLSIQDVSHFRKRFVVGGKGEGPRVGEQHSSWA